MEFILLSDAQKQAFSPQIKEMMRACDTDFVPPLSARFSPKDTAFSAQTVSEKGIEAYYSSMLRERMLAAVEGEHLLGFVTFMENLTCKHFGEESFPNLYICTLLLSPDTRGRGITRQMYTYLFDTLYPKHNLFTRTWSTNAAHIKILSRFGFDLIARIENDRGEGIDTVYFVKRRG